MPIAKKSLKKAAKKVASTKLTPTEEKRVVILKDALAQIKIGAYDVRSSNGFVVNDELEGKIILLCEISDVISDKGKKEEFKTFIDRMINKKKPCEVCAKGALFLSSIRKFNNVSLASLEDESLNDMADVKTRRIFGDTNADLMEEYFEHDFDSYLASLDDEEVKSEYYDEDEVKKNNFAGKHRDDDSRLIAIIENAIKNKGTFKP